jgi:CMP-N,N'-diacetyllegionaminic acid synthase
MAIEGLNVLAVVPARGGSKSIPDKNLQKVGGISLVGRAAEIAFSLPWIDAALISTDDSKIAEEARQHGLDVPFMRPAELSTDTANSKDMWRHAWLAAEQHYGKRFDLSILLEPTSPLRHTEDVERTVKALFQNNAPAAVTLSPTPAHFTPHKTLTLDEKNTVGFYLQNGASFARRQDIPGYYHRNGVCYAVRRHHLLENNSIIEGGAIAVVIERPLVNIDDPLELQFANWLFALELNQSDTK